MAIEIAASGAVTDDPVMFVPIECIPDIENLITEDGAPVDGVFSEKQMRLLTESLISSWPGPGNGRPFVAMANVGLFYNWKKPALVPDVLLSVDIELPASLFPKNARSYFIWEYDKAPDVVVEVVSNREGGEDTVKLDKYARIGIRFYVIFDPENRLGPETVRVFRLEGMKFTRMQEPFWFPEVDLGLQLWHGAHEKIDAIWLRWVDSHGVIVPTGNERANAEAQRANAEAQRANAEAQRANAEHVRAERLAEALRKLGGNPDSV